MDRLDGLQKVKEGLEGAVLPTINTSSRPGSEATIAELARKNSHLESELEAARFEILELKDEVQELRNQLEAQVAKEKESEQPEIIINDEDESGCQVIQLEDSEINHNETDGVYLEDTEEEALITLEDDAIYIEANSDSFPTAADLQNLTLEYLNFFNSIERMKDTFANRKSGDPVDLFYYWMTPDRRAGLARDLATGQLFAETGEHNKDTVKKLFLKIVDFMPDTAYDLLQYRGAKVAVDLTIKILESVTPENLEHFTQKLNTPRASSRSSAKKFVENLL